MRNSSSNIGSLQRAIELSRRDQSILEASGRRDIADLLLACRSGEEKCNLGCCKPCCHEQGIRRSRALRKLLKRYRKRRRIITILVGLIAPGDLHTIDRKRLFDWLRKRLDKAGFSGSLVAGGLEVVWQPKLNGWVVHFHLLSLGARKKQRDALKASFASSDLKRPFVCQKLRDPEWQISYLLKLSTYFRPFDQTGKRKGRAVPLKPPQMLESLSWYANFKPSDFLFLYGLRRRGDRICPTLKRQSAKR